MSEELDLLLNLASTCLKEISSFKTDSSSFETWLTSAEELIESSHGHIGLPETLEHLEATHKVSLEINTTWLAWSTDDFKVKKRLSKDKKINMVTVANPVAPVHGRYFGSGFLAIVLPH